MSSPISTSGLPVKMMMLENALHQQTELLTADNDLHGGVRVEMKEPMDSEAFVSMLKASLSHWRQQGKKGVWIKLPIELANLVEPAVQEGFKYHHAEPDYLMLVYWIPETGNALPANASHRVGIGAFVMNNKREVLVVQESTGAFKDTVDTQDQLIQLLEYKKDPNFTIVKHIEYMYHWMKMLWLNKVHEFSKEQQLGIVLDALPDEWKSVRKAIKSRWSFIEFNTLADEMQLEREHQHAAMGIRRTGRSARCLDPPARFVPWYETCTLDGNEDELGDDIVGDPDYVPTI